MIEWPAIIKCANEDELLYLHSESEWLELQPLAVVQKGDQLVDSQGMCFTFDGQTLAHPAVQLKLDRVLQLVRQHASVCGHCCVSKMGAPGIAEAVALVKEIE